jgi:hypothetical protein
MRTKTLSLLALSFIFFNTSNASEADTFTRRNEALDDAAEIINLKTNKAIQESLQLANAKNNGCAEKDLYKDMRVYFNNHMKGKLTIDLMNNPDVPKREIGLAKSVYGNWSPWDGLGLGLGIMKKTKATLSDIVRVGDQLVGLDKFEHMFGQGFMYFDDNYLQEKGAVYSARMGAFREKTILGGNKFANGVFAYGDLAANFNGMRMWNHMLQKRDDVLGVEHNIGPYISCVDNKWEQVKEIDMRSYIDDSMDETINCSKFTSESTVKKFKKNIEVRGFSGCPIDQQRLNDLVVKYGAMSKWMLNKKGSGVVKYFSEFKDK